MFKFSGFGRTKNRRIGKGKRKKIRRLYRGLDKDGWQRKRAGRLRPQMRSSKKELQKELQNADNSLFGLQGRGY